MMSFYPKKLLFINIRNCLRLQLSTSCTEKWDLVSSVCLERRPVITKAFNKLESKYSQVVSKVEFEMSCKSDHEIRIVKDKLYAEEMKKSDTFIDKDEINLQTAQEFEDNSEEELKKFKFGERTTQEDLKNVVTSTNRKLGSSLYLVVKQKIGENSYWVLPQGVRQDGEAMRQSAERVLKETCGDIMQVKFLGNAPCGFYKYKYPKGANITSSLGMKIFFFKAYFLGGTVTNNLCPDFQWLTQSELDIMHDGYLKSVNMFLIDDEDEN